MTDYSAHLIAALNALLQAEDAANSQDWLAMQHAAEQAAIAAIACEQWADARLRETHAQ
jgi:uncharacterized protein YqfA (UPF0365 family)